MKEAFPQVDIITVNYNGSACLADYCAGLRALDYPKERIRLFFVDNGSRDGSLESMRTCTPGFAVEIVENGRNLGFARANNLILGRASAPYVALLNNDAKVEPGWLKILVAKLESDPAIGIVSSRQVPKESERFIEAGTNRTSWCSGGHCVIRKSVLERAGFFDERFFMYGEDVDLSWRIWLAGFSCVYVPEAVCEHHRTRDSRYDFRRYYFHVRNSILLRYKYAGALAGFRESMRWTKEAGSRIIRRGLFSEGFVILEAVLGHVFLILHFLESRRHLINEPDFEAVKRQWIRL
ncbi:MAG: glycosyltransferase family 2 protein [Candidatus Omnitrophica bacterium]|nr:glycosyltransferase family 2 protein [Candidatus Omnitrophota bacterium]